ncbi:GNAT family N-acetyltransferase [Microbacterium binotii]|uniref:GNAT family N-acetyltransferase n=1 Tax=Microbacterium binotii TaxID=462710 RepID=UPI001F1C9F77|nr:GNAT family N-acetyltransferase [Microbacterium binotii]UIN31764.1 GNAT family N-acetyltransferase [Microbacterium binotii]
MTTDDLIPRVRIPLAGAYEIDTDRERIDLERVHRWLSTDAFWALGRSFDVVQRAAAASVNFGVYDPAGAQVGYARVVTDGVTFGWLCDVYVAPEVRGLGLGKALAAAVVDATRPLGLKRLMLSTLDAHELYARVGFAPFPDPDRLMVVGAS